MELENIPVSVYSRNNRDLPATPGTISLVKYDKKDISKNTLKTFGMGIAFTFASVFIPILHFILVPSLFIASFVLAIDKSRETKRNQGGSGECPKCHKQFQIQKSKWTDRLVDVCGECHDDLEILIHDTL
jgi:hypothetical protein